MDWKVKRTYKLLLGFGMPFVLKSLPFMINPTNPKSIMNFMYDHWVDRPYKTAAEAPDLEHM